MLANLNECPICNSKTTVEEILDRMIYKVNCLRCGKFEITNESLTMFQRSELSDKILSISYWIRQNQSQSGRVKIDLITMRNKLIPFISPKPKEQANKLLIWIGDNFPKPNDEIVLEFNDLISVVGAYDADGVEYILKYLIENERIFSQGNLFSDKTGYSGSMSFKGWDRYFELQHSNKDSRLAFMAMQYDNNTLQKIYSDVIIKSVSDTGFEIRKLDDVKRAGLIDDKLRVEIRLSKFIIADLTDDNRGAYWEAGFAEGLGLHVIYICEEEKFKEEKPHFYTNHHLTVTWKDTKEGLEKFIDELKATIRATFPVEAKMED